MVNKERIQPLCAPMYAVLYAELRILCKGHGYALTIHGSLKRDLDLVAVPWIEKCSEPEILANAIQEYIGCAYSHPDSEDAVIPHGRKRFVFHLDEHPQNGMYGKGPYIDLSVMPVSKKDVG